MSDLLKIAQKSLLEPAALSVNQLEEVVGRALGVKIDSADLYLQNIQAEEWFLEDGIVKDGSFHIDRGFGLRAISGETVGFAYADELALPALTQAAEAAKSIVKSGAGKTIRLAGEASPPVLYPGLNPLETMTEQDKVALLHRLDKYARSLDARIEHVMVRLVGVHEVMMVLASDGTMAADIRPLVRLSVQVILHDNGRREQGYAGAGTRGGYDFFEQDNCALACVERAVRQAERNVQAKPMPAGAMPVVLGAGWPAVLLHEAVGHGLEGDFNRRGSSAFSGRIGQKVASALCTIVDDGTLPNRRGSLTVDDEGTPSQYTTLIENGVLKGYMFDKHNARLMGLKSTGNGRRESYAHLPIPRMTNTYMLPGESEPEEIIASVQRGLYAVDFAGGQVDITSGKFVFSASEAYMIENGKVTYPVKGATLIGNGPEVMTQVTMLGNDLKLDNGIGTCGKDGQSVPVGVGQPTLKIDSMTVGGEQC